MSMSRDVSVGALSVNAVEKVSCTILFSAPLDSSVVLGRIAALSHKGFGHVRTNMHARSWLDIIAIRQSSTREQNITISKPVSITGLMIHNADFLHTTSLPDPSS